MVAVTEESARESDGGIGRVRPRLTSHTKRRCCLSVLQFKLGNKLIGRHRSDPLIEALSLIFV